MFVSKSIVVVEKLTYQVGSHTSALLYDISFRLMEASFTVLCGANGCGKSLLLQQLNGLLRPTSGSIYLDGRNIWDDIWDTRRQIGLVFQDPECQLIGETVREDIGFGLENMGFSMDKCKEKISLIAQQLQITHLLDRYQYQLSGGEKHLVALAGVLVMGAKVVVLDEPFNALDYSATQKLLLRLLELQKQQQTTILLVTHDLEKVLAHTNHLIVMSKGQIALQGTPDEILPQVAQFGVKVPALHARKIGDLSWLI